MAAAYFEARERTFLGEAYERCYSAPPQVFRGVTVNTLRCTPQAFQALAPKAYALCASSFCPQGFLLQNDTLRPGLSPYHHAGVYYVQEPSASGAAPMLCVQPGDRVLDVCAAPGGKSAQLAAALQGQGLLVANEYVARRAAVLRSNLERMGVANALVLSEDAARLAAVFPGYFNKVLVDAPCSGEGMFRKETEAVRQHSEALVLQCAALGREILNHAAACVAPGGLLAYSTCTFSPQENEQQIVTFLQSHPDFTLLPVPLQVGSAGEKARVGAVDFPVEHTRRIYPCHGGEGHFLALLQRAGAPAATPVPLRRERRGKPLPQQALEFLQEYFPALPHLQTQEAWKAGEQLSLLPQTALPEKALARLRVLQAGVQIGGVDKGRFVPAHHLFMAFGAQCANTERLQAQDARTAAWLRGEEIADDTAAQGYCAVLCEGFPLGFGKQTGGKIKNHYPKGLRNLK